MEQEIFLPTLSSMEYGNPWTGSRGNTRWRIVPADGTMHTEVWYGPMCLECSEVAAQADFPVTPEGLEALRDIIRDESRLRSFCELLYYK